MIVIKLYIYEQYTCCLKMMIINSVKEQENEFKVSMDP